MRTYSILQKKPVVLSYLIIIFIIPPIGIKFNFIPSSPLTNFITLAVCTLACVLIMLKERWDLYEWDIKAKTGTIKVYIKPYIWFTFFGLIFILVMKNILSLKYATDLFEKKYFWYLLIFICFLQVLSYRTFLFKKLGILVQDQKKLIVLNTIIFTTMHVMFSWKFIIICFLGGLGFGYMYYNYPSLLLMTISHSILNLAAALCGAFSPN